MAGFPAVRTAHIVENGLYLAVLALWTIHILALADAVLVVAGLGALMVGALPHVWQDVLSDLYHVPGATPDEQATLVMVWQAIQGVMDSLLVIGLVLIPLGYLAIGSALRRVPGLGSGPARLVTGLGCLGMLAGSVLLVDESVVAVAGIGVLVVFHLVIGAKGRRLARLGAPRSPEEA